MEKLLTGSNGFIGRAINHVFDSGLTGVDLTLNTNFAHVFKQYPVVIHCAATSNVPDCEANPHAAIVNNVLNTIELIRNTKPHHFVFISSAAAKNATSIYGKTKLILEEYLKDCRINYTILRPYNVIGYYTFTEQTQPANLIPSIKRAILSQKPLQVFGNKIRDYVDVLDVALTVKWVVDNKIYGTYDVCSGVGTSTLDIVKHFNLEYKLCNNRAGDEELLIGDPTFDVKIPLATSLENIKRSFMNK